MGGFAFASAARVTITHTYIDSGLSFVKIDILKTAAVSYDRIDIMQNEK